MRLLIGLILLLAWTPFASSQQSSQPPPVQLNDEELDRILGQLRELKACRAVVFEYEAFVKREAEQRERDRASYERALEVERRDGAVKQKEIDLATEKWKFYEQMYNMVTKKKGGVGCFLKKLFTFWIARC